MISEDDAMQDRVRYTEKGGLARTTKLKQQKRRLALKARIVPHSKLYCSSRKVDRLAGLTSSLCLG
jgi:hypothetical protein